MSSLVQDKDLEEIVFEATVFCGGAGENDESQSETNSTNVFNEELDLYNPPSPAPQIDQPLDYRINNDSLDPDYHATTNLSSDSGNEIDNLKRKNHKTKRKKLHFIFNRKLAGVKLGYVNKMTDNKPYDFFRIFLDDNFIQKMVNATNDYARLCKENNEVINSWIQPWHDTNVEEMKKFIGMIIWMGLVKYPTMNSYWCRSYLYTNYIVSSVSRSQFQLLSHMWRLGNDDDSNCDTDSPLINELRKKFKQMLVAPELFAIEKMFIPGENESEGVNILFLNLKGGYIYDFKVHNGKKTRKINVKDAMSLIDNMLDRGRIMCSHEDLTSVELADKLKERKTHLVGLINPESRYIPAELKSKRLHNDQSKSYTTIEGLIFRKYHPHSEKYLLTTRGSGTIDEYYKYKSATTISPDLKVKNSVLANSMNWYQKYALEVIINTCLVNACYLYRRVRTQKISSIRFLEDVITGLLDMPTNIKPSTLTLGKLGIDNDSVDNDHTLVRLSKRKRCVRCYERICRDKGRKDGMNKTPKTPHQCKACNKSFCMECFFEFHSGRLRNLN